MSLVGQTKRKILREFSEQPSHGYELAEKLDISHGYVYTHLSELRDEGMIELQKEENGKKVYQLTENGELLLQALRID